MKYNAKYDRYVTKGGLVYRYDSKQDKLVLCKLTQSKDGYLVCGVIKPKRKTIRVHRMVYETFVGEIPEDMVIDHINTIRDDNRLENLRVTTQKENNNNPLTKQKRKGKTRSEESKKRISESKKGNTNKRGKTYSEFGTKFKEHFGITRYQDKKLYYKEYWLYVSHNKKCSWEE